MQMGIFKNSFACLGSIDMNIKMWDSLRKNENILEEYVKHGALTHIPWAGSCPTNTHTYISSFKIIYMKQWKQDYVMFFFSNYLDKHWQNLNLNNWWKNATC